MVSPHFEMPPIRSISPDCCRRQLEGGTDRLRAGEPGGHIDRGAKGQHHHWSDARRRHQPAADLIVAHDLKQLAVKHAELLAQDPAGDQQRFDDRGQVRMDRNQLTNSSLELDRAHHANLEAEIAQRASRSFSMSSALACKSWRLVSSMRRFWLASVFTCTGRYRPTRIICVMPRASLRSLLLISADSAAFICRVSTQITGKPASA